MFKCKYIFFVLTLSLVAAAKPKTVPKPSQDPPPIHKQSFDYILKNYLFVADFSEKEPERRISKDVFWRYPLQIPKINFPVEYALNNPSKDVPATPGDGMATHHMNRGRVFFLDGNYEEAKNIWLAGRARYKQQYPYHRRTDYFIGLAFLNIAAQQVKEAGGNWQDLKVKGTLANAATFLSWAFIRKADEKDELADAAAPRQLYNLAAIYFMYERYPAAYGAANNGLEYLRKTGRIDYRPQFQRVIVESFVKAQNYLEAVQTIDTAIRQDPDIKQAAAMFTRVGDIYFNQNNYELAEEAYAIGNKLDQDVNRLNPAQFVLQGETLFWLGRFAESQKLFHYALEGAARKEAVTDLPRNFAAFAQLRIADAFLAQKQYEQARLGYFKVSQEYRDSEAAKIAGIRSACLELPQYDGKNVEHARKLLVDAAKEELSPILTEMSTACNVASYAARERTPEMVGRVKQFAEKYPESPVLKEFFEPVRAVQAKKLDEYFARKEKYEALSFFEKNRKTLFPKISSDRQRLLFAAYAEAWRSDAASEFWRAYAELPDSDAKLIRQAVVVAEMTNTSKMKTTKKTATKVQPKWLALNKQVATKLGKHKWSTSKPSPQNFEFLQRVLASQTANEHIVWATNLAEHWSRADATLTCSLYYSLLTRGLGLRNVTKEQRAHLRQKSLALVEKSLPDLFKQDASCAQSLLELEQVVLAGSPQELAKRYLARKDWEFTAPLISMAWVTAERMFEQRQKDAAKNLWRLIVEKAPADAPELVLAKARLDERKAETEEMWDR